ncbi:LysR family transcriptional regulator [Pandoraea sputorum]|uniref:CysJI operon transcriptional activator n=1 Tax=Pandoraea sputorum TaxID=93222 RepID=A0A239SS60_9BURK|nr:LysR family transcriptional regulator [Pandoraea sputorum]AJC18153.1 LysR family transcriptional regulator [Pandoraea sputorum]SNU87483.1 CysJI operon transcriptional activator [Pandoraea sputorum]
MRRLNLDQLNTFAEVVDAGSFSAAAVRLDLSQPAVSLQVRQLEQRLNVRLIERVGKRLKPTSAGLTLLEHARRIDAAVEEAMQVLSSHARGVAGEVAIGTGATACIHLLPPMLRAMRKRHPQLDIRVSTGNTDDVVAAVTENRLDIGLVTLPAAGRSLHVTPVLRDEFVAIAPANDNTWGDEVTPHTLAAAPMVAFESGSSTRLLIDDWFLQAGLRMRPVMALGSIEAIKEMVAAGLGYSIVPKMSVNAVHHRRGLRISTLTPELTRTLAIVVRQDKPLTPGLRKVLSALEGLGSVL